MNNDDAKRIDINESSPINITLVDNTPLPIEINVVKEEPQPIEIEVHSDIISGAANLHELGDVVSDGAKVYKAKDNFVLMYNADGRHPGKWMAGEVDLSDYATKNDLDKLRRNISTEIERVEQKGDDNKKAIDSLDKTVAELRDDISKRIDQDVDTLGELIEKTQVHLEEVREDLLDKEAWLDVKIEDVKKSLLTTKDELVDAKGDLYSTREELKALGVDHIILAGIVDDERQTITSTIKNLEEETDRVNILRSEMDGINLTIKNEIISNFKDGDFEVTQMVGQWIDARAETIETGVKKLREGTDETFTSWIGQKIDGRAETIETAISKLREGTDETMVSWVGQKIDGAAQTITTGIIESIERADYASKSFVGQEIDGAEGRITTGVMEYIESGDFASKSFVGQEIDGAEGRIETAYKKWVEDQDFSTTTWVGQEINGAEGRITTSYENYVKGQGFATTQFVGQEIDGVNGKITNATTRLDEIVAPDGTISERLQGAFTTWQLDEIRSAVVDQQGNFIKSSEILQETGRISLYVAEKDEEYVGKFSTIDIKLDSVSTVVANGDNYAAIIARVNDQSSEVLIDANKIFLLGETVAEYLKANEVEVTGKITARELILGSNVLIPYENIDGPDLSIYISKDGVIGNTPEEGVTGFTVSHDGLLQASNAVIYGTLYSSSGLIGGWTIDRDAIRSNREGANTILGYEGHLYNYETDNTGKLWKHWELNSDGSGSIANEAITWSPYGDIKLKDNVIIGETGTDFKTLIENVSKVLTMFGIDENGDVYTQGYWHDNEWHWRGFYSNSFVSARGRQPGGSGSGGGGGTDLITVWESLSVNNPDVEGYNIKIDTHHIPFLSETEFMEIYNIL